MNASYRLKHTHAHARTRTRTHTRASSCKRLVSCCSFETQRNGLVFIYDMAGSNYTNFELDLSKKILNLLKVTSIFHQLLDTHSRTDLWVTTQLSI